MVSSKGRKNSNRANSHKTSNNGTPSFSKKKGVKGKTNSGKETIKTKTLTPTAKPAPFLARPKWMKLVHKTQKFANYNSMYFNFPPVDTVSSFTTTKWVETKPSTKRRDALPIVAIDCEMCVTEHVESQSRDSKAIVRISVVDGLDPNRVVFDAVIKQPEEGRQIVDFKTDIHGIPPELIQESSMTLRAAQKKLLKFISSETIIVGHSVYGDLKSMRMIHSNCVDTAMIFKREGVPMGEGMPGLKDLAYQLLQSDMPDCHDSILDAQMTMKVAQYAFDNGSDNIEIKRMDTSEQIQNPSNHHNVKNELRVHRIPEGVTVKDLEHFFISNTNVVPVLVDSITWKQSKSLNGSTRVTFVSDEHSELAFNTASGRDNVDKIGRKQKQVNIVTSAGKQFEGIQIGKSYKEVMVNGKMM